MICHLIRFCTEEGQSPINVRMSHIFMKLQQAKVGSGVFFTKMFHLYIMLHKGDHLEDEVVTNFGGFCNWFYLIV